VLLRARVVIAADGEATRRSFALSHVRGPKEQLSNPGTGGVCCFCGRWIAPGLSRAILGAGSSPRDGSRGAQLAGTEPSRASQRREVYRSASTTATLTTLGWPAWSARAALWPCGGGREQEECCAVRRGGGCGLCGAGREREGEGERERERQAHTERELNTTTSHLNSHHHQPTPLRTAALGRAAHGARKISGQWIPATLALAQAVPGGSGCSRCIDQGARLLYACLSAAAWRLARPLWEQPGCALGALTGLPCRVASSDGWRAQVGRRA
jgi:hypothetical protein